MVRRRDRQRADGDTPCGKARISPLSFVSQAARDDAARAGDAVVAAGEVDRHRADFIPARLPTISENFMYVYDSIVAVRVGFEPTEPAKVQRFSRPPDSTALAPHRFL